ncbi:DUF3793 family protein [Fusibacter paucivorans]|uniref:DUF3793 family protein n=1 Tax=Fusibacter paucivorans TaxID=76009 RepID=A0ABS5PQH9_9FIRM|nr:DUF3793 family protein [Fusibacter paucivorans]MBS7526292.1 DUF3793 family protein [Fusibacter paucivorans]
MQIDFLLAYYCAPTLYGLKPSNLILHETDNTTDDDCELTETLLSRGIKMLKMRSCSKRTLTLVYDEKRLEMVLADAEVSAFLASRGYTNDHSVTEKLTILKHRMRKETDFPHEVGVFLGYPMTDVRGFIEHKGKHCKYCGYWKVYGDVDDAKQRFNTFTAVRDELLRHLQHGTKLTEIIKSA